MPRGVSDSDAPLFVRASSAPPLPVLKIAQTELKSSLKPTCWKGSPLKVAVNSRVVPGVKLASGPTSAPSTVRTPPATPAGAAARPRSDAPIRRERRVERTGRRPAARWTSTSVAVPAFVPAAKSAGSTSCRHAPALPLVVKLAGAAGGAGSVAELPEASVEVTR